MTYPLKRVAALAAVATLAGVLAGCGGSDSPAGGGEAPDPDSPTPITVGSLPAGDYAPLYIADQEGFFEEEGLDVTIETIAGGAVGVTQLVSGELEFTSATWTNTLAAVAQGLEVVVVREGTDSSKAGINGLLVDESAGFSSIEDLRGETLAVNTLQSATEVQLRDCLATGGLAADDYELVEVPFPEVGAAVLQDRIAGGFVPEPFITIGAPEGLVSLFDPSVCNERQENSPLITWDASKAWAEENPEIVDAFVRAMDKATQLAIDDPQVVVDILPTFTTLTPEIAGELVLPSFVEDGTPSVEGAELTQELMLEYELIDSPIEDLSQYAWQGE
ncbi:sulfonate ABC transporter substrate-binding protein [Microbacterium faecale]|uniref:Sulfonate ABC transporter substrate-binding protein n=1 Tax=Microbacterium faecale TaxID=1804630 RepID=A0A917DH35_9MICO|nr:ABC transporter substrate-binding protein [Microbacterium faecale]GGD36861.1 sulfonate ABC transporter substrate-binding protein [Microbacterium faecale]